MIIMMPSTQLIALSRAALQVAFKSLDTNLMWCKLTPLLLLVPVHDSTDKGRDQTGTGISTSSSLQIPNIRWLPCCCPLLPWHLQQNMATKQRAWSWLGKSMKPNCLVKQRESAAIWALGRQEEESLLTWPKEKSKVMLQLMPCFCRYSQALMPSHVEAICIWSIHQWHRFRMHAGKATSSKYWSQVVWAVVAFSKGKPAHLDVDLLGDINVVLAIQVDNFQCLQQHSHN